MRSFSTILPALILAPLVLVPSLQSAQAKPLSVTEIKAAMVGKTIYTRSFGMSVKMIFRANGTVSASAILGTSNGTWRPKGDNQICTTFPSGPAKGTRCVTYIKTGKNRYRTSDGTNFRVEG